MPDTIPLFPLHTVLFPGGSLPLRIFEPRYIDLVSECLRENKGFGVCLIKSGNEVGQAAEPERIGTYAWIRDSQRTPDGLLGITIQGQRRFQILSIRIQKNNLLRGDISWLAQEPAVAVPARYRMLQDLLRSISGQQGIAVALEMDDAAMLGYRLAEILPADRELRQRLLEISDPMERLETLFISITARKSA
jgi:Lon protease-like protein